MGVGSWGQGAVAPLDFQTSYKYSGLRFKSAIFQPFLLFFGLFLRCPLSSWKRLISAIFWYFFANFRSFFRGLPHEKFSADALALA